MIALFILWVIYIAGIPLYYTPYYLQPSFWEFKNMCELDFLSNSTQRTKKLLQFFKINDSDLQKNLKIDNNGYVARFKYDTLRIKSQLNIEMDLQKNIKKIYESGSIWYTWRPDFLGNEGNMDFRIVWDDYFTCGNILIMEYPKCFENNKFICERR